MKKGKSIFIALALTCSLLSCATNQQHDAAAAANESAKEGVKGRLIEVEGSSSEETSRATNKFENSETKLWTKSDWNKNSSVYLKTDGDSDIISFVTTGNGNKMLSTKIDFSKQKEYALLVSTAKDGKTYDLSKSILKIRIYIPAEFINKNLESILRFVIYYGNDTKYKTDSFSGLQAFHFSDIGHGWQTISLDFKNKNFSLGKRQGKFDLLEQAVKNSRLLGINIQALEAASASGNVLIDWVSVEAAP